MTYAERNWQYRQLATIYHGPRFGHYLELEVQVKGRDSTKRVGLGQWTGVGVPEDVLRTSTSLWVAVWEDHLITRYGVQGELPSLWGGEPDPF